MKSNLERAILLAIIIGCTAVCGYWGRDFAIQRRDAQLSASMPLSDAGFESGSVGGSFPKQFGRWSGDLCEVQARDQGIVARSGNGMLKFVSTDAALTANRPTRSCQMVQLVDLGPTMRQLRDGEHLAVLSGAYFNRVAGNQRTDTMFIVTLYAFAGAPRDFPQDFAARRQLAAQRQQILTDADPATWELAEVGLVVPRGARYLAISIQAYENVFNDVTGAEFDGHYADDVFLAAHIVPPAQ